MILLILIILQTGIRKWNFLASYELKTLADYGA